MKVDQLLEAALTQYELDWDSHFNTLGDRPGKPATKKRTIGKGGIPRDYQYVRAANIKNFKCLRPWGIPGNLLLDACHIESFDGIEDLNIIRLVIDGCSFGPNELNGLKSTSIRELKLNTAATLKNGFIGVALPGVDHFWSIAQFKSLTQIHKALPEADEIEMFIDENATNVLGVCLLSTPSFGFHLLSWKGANSAPNKPLYKLIKNKVSNGKDGLLDFQKELIDAGFPTSAKL